MESGGLEGSVVLLVEDEESLAIGLEYNLTEEGYRVVRAADGAEALARFESEPVDLIILDLMLPHIDGFEVARRVRERAPQIPILMLTARATAADRIRGLEFGADDYLTKPFHLKELLLRVRGMLRRKQWYRKLLQKGARYRFGDNEVDFGTLECTAKGKSLRLTPLEAGLLKYLVENAGRVVPREELLKNVWQTHGEVETRTVDNFIVRLRRYFEPNPSEPRYFVNVRGAGYEFRPG
ncbi:MAG: response regulator transcription factor [Spirochaetales bacterium]|nr:response regulator transcription factor [Spirochaetales bacterium]